MVHARWRGLVVALAAVAVVAAACGGDDEGGGTTGGNGGGGASDGTTITIRDFAFDPATLQVSGQATLTVTNEDSTAHTFTLDDGSVDQDLAPGDSAEVTVEVSETTGFHCEIHPNMTGTLEVA